MKSPTASLAMLLAAFCLSGPCAYAAKQTPAAELDFEIVGGRIYIPIELNGHKISAVLDSGAGSTVVDLDLVNRWGLPSGGNLSVFGGGNAMVGGKFLTKAVATFAGISEPVPIAIPINPLDKMEGRHIEAIVGYHFFMTHVVVIDYQKRHLRIFNPSTEFHPAGIPMPVRLQGSLCHLTTELKMGNDRFNLETIVDTGASGSVLTTKFLDNHRLSVAATPSFEIGAGVGGVTRGRMFRPDSVHIGTAEVIRPIVGMTESGGGVVGKGSLFDFLLGAEILQRFVVTFDYSHRTVAFQPNSDAGKPFEADKTGLRIFAEGQDLRVFRVIGLLPGSAGEKAGIQPGDEIETIDGLPASNYTLQELREVFKSPLTPKWKLGIKRDALRLKIDVEAKSIL